MTNEQDHAASAPATECAAGRKIVNLALQGGGSHGAFTWGVLDRLLEESRLEFEGVTGTSAGAVNAVVLADGLAAGGRATARGRRCGSTGKKCRRSRPAVRGRLPLSTRLTLTTVLSIHSGSSSSSR